MKTGKPFEKNRNRHLTGEDGKHKRKKDPYGQGYLD